jgi:hypothetical protein
MARTKQTARRTVSNMIPKPTAGKSIKKRFVPKGNPNLTSYKVTNPPYNSKTKRQQISFKFKGKNKALK